MEIRDKHPYMMWETILSTPNLIPEIGNHMEEIRKVAKLLREKDFVYITGCGTSYNLALTFANFLNNYGKKCAIALPAYEMLHHVDVVDASKSAIVSISHSGGTGASVQVLNKLLQSDILKIAITNTDKSRIMNVADASILVPGWEEVGPKTRSYTLGLIVALLVSMLVGEKDFEIVEYLERISKGLKQEIDRWVTEIKDLSEKMLGRRIYVVGAGPNYGVAAEAALKIMETSNVPAFAMELEEIGHGPIATVVNEETVLFVLKTPKDEARAKDVVNAAKEMGAMVVEFSNKITEGGVKIPYDDESLIPVYTIVPMQMVAYWLAVSRNVFPDLIRKRGDKHKKALDIILG
ncbi:SIS domain-containing protein [Thermoanaerobacter wiegelii]|uniref:Glutamine--fructose-6-phosphate aminotransferase [isomerizing] n=1 Tax=Thermoanaerobacter wiegelii Rt8.B1 TaxID=697303 RepID=G2MUV7_9THEO|nr:SIS domain-containing protein [Thermoanaerobacter wiegelii]AEM77858.1 sugar isomerase (SIS) [Thermoanaerobacter wiegelii Rt8.B1]